MKWILAQCQETENHVTPISRIFTRGNARFVYHLVGLVGSHATPHRDPDFRCRFSLATDPQILGIGVKALLFDSEHAECSICQEAVGGHRLLRWLWVSDGQPPEPSKQIEHCSLPQTF